MLYHLSKEINSQKTGNMNIALIGYGRMGHEIEAIAVQREHNVKLVIDKDNTSDLNEENLRGIDVVIEFSLPEAAFENIMKCLSAKVAVVSGTTGWLENYDKAVAACKENQTSFIHSTNFSIGINILFRINSELARLMSKFNGYSVGIEEIHHTRKLDAPSGTAITLASGITGNHGGYEGWTMDSGAGSSFIPINAVREGNVPGIHIVEWDSDVDTLTLRHESKSRRGLALGAVVAAEFINGRKGIFTMNDVLGI